MWRHTRRLPCVWRHTSRLPCDVTSARTTSRGGRASLSRFQEPSAGRVTYERWCRGEQERVRTREKRQREDRCPGLVSPFLHPWQLQNIATVEKHDVKLWKENYCVILSPKFWLQFEVAEIYVGTTTVYSKLIKQGNLFATLFYIESQNSRSFWYNFQKMLGKLWKINKQKPLHSLAYFRMMKFVANKPITIKN